MKYKVLNTSQDIRESIYRLMIRKKISKIYLSDKMGLSYPSMLNIKIDMVYQDLLKNII